VRSFLHVLSEAISRGECHALVIGGYSLEAYGFQRPTKDIDLLVAAPQSGILASLLERTGFREAGRNDICARYVHTDPLLFPVDLLFVNQATWDRMWPASREAMIEGASVHVPSPEHLISLKLHAMKNDPHGREQDFGDIVRIAAGFPKEVPLENLRAICDQYGPAGIFDQLSAALRREP
jgi:hypothetical protein